MPDIGPALTFSNKIGAVEDQYTAEVRRVHKDARRELLDIVTFYGIKSPMLKSQIKRVVDQMGVELQNVGRDQQRKVITYTKKYGQIEFDKMRAYIKTVPQFGMVHNRTEPERRKKLAVLEETPVWLGAYYAALIGELNRLQNSDEEEAAAVNRLLSTKITDGRASTWRKAKNNGELQSGLDLWSVAAGLMGMYFVTGQETSGTPWSRQVIAAIDENTTDCCLRAHGQIQPVGKPFQLFGTPRFADRMMHTPFHWRCRTSIALYHEAMEGIGVTTPQMREAARAEINARAKTGFRVEIHPADSTSGR